MRSITKWRYSVVTSTVLFSFFILFFSSCDDPDDIGLGIQGNQVGVVHSDTFTITSSVVLLDSLSTGNLNFIPVGAYSDPEFGSVQASFFSRMRMLKPEKSLGTNPTVDSIVLTLEILDYYGDTTQSQTIEVYELDQTINSPSQYNNLSTLAYSNMVGTKTFTASPKGSGQIKINITNTFNAGDLAGLVHNSSQTTFNSSINGLAIVPQSPTMGTLMLFEIADSSKTKVRMFYHNDEGDTTVYDFKFNKIRHFHNLVGDRSTIPFLNPLINKKDEVASTIVDDQLYVQSGTGLQTKLMFPTLKDLNKLGNIMVNRAELIITPISGSTVGFNPPASLTFVKLDINGNVMKKYGRRMLLQNLFVDQEDTLSNLTASYDDVNKRYIVPLNTALQQILLGNDIFGGLMISTPSVSETYSISGIGFKISHSLSLEGSFRRLVFGSEDHVSENVKLKIYYTPLN